MAPRTLQSDLVWSVSPNPFHDLLTVQFEFAKPLPVTLALTDALGRLVSTPCSQRSFEAGQQSLDLELGQLSPGLYYLTLSTPEGRWVQKVVKND